jgi:hypothetical protein
MTNIPSVINYIQEEETAAYAPVSESTLFKVGGSMNYLLDHYPYPTGSDVVFCGLEVDVNLAFMIPQDGRAVSRTGATANLFAVIGTLYGVGDGITTFNVPDMRGIFVRMVDLTTAGQSGRDPDHAIRTPTGTGTSEQPGSYQTDAYGDHTHSYPTRGGVVTGSDYSVPAINATDPTPQHTTDGEGSTIQGPETRSKNLYKLICIKT